MEQLIGPSDEVPALSWRDDPENARIYARHQGGILIPDKFPLVNLPVQSSPVIVDRFRMSTTGSACMSNEEEFHRAFYQAFPGDTILSKPRDRMRKHSHVGELRACNSNVALYDPVKLYLYEGFANDSSAIRAV